MKSRKACRSVPLAEDRVGVGVVHPLIEKAPGVPGDGVEHGEDLLELRAEQLGPAGITS